MKPDELMVRRRIVAEYLRRQGTDLEFFRKERVEDNAGGWKEGEETSQGIQRFRVVDNSATNISRTFPDFPAGLLLQYDVVLVGNWNATVVRGDEFVHGERRFRVEHLMLNPQDRVVAGARLVS